MQFRTQIPVSKSNHPIDYHSRIVSLGSCFAENIGEKFDYFKFQNTTNPYGIIFNPVSIEKILRRVTNKKKYTESDIFFHNGKWHCFEVHSEVSGSNKELFLAHLNKLLDQTFMQISEATHLVITYGTSWIYREKDHGEVVANCHKLPQRHFDKVLLSVAENQMAIEKSIAVIRQLNAAANIIFTISPVRHIKDGFVENQLSKAHLITALQASIHLSFSNYFPSYEIMMDELRDYRFYASDMLHPNTTAIDYIWQVFSNSWVSEDAKKVMQEIGNIQKSLHHRPFDAESSQHLEFLSNLQQRIDTIQSSFPHIRF